MRSNNSPSASIDAATFISDILNLDPMRFADPKKIVSLSAIKLNWFANPGYEVEKNTKSI